MWRLVDTLFTHKPLPPSHPHTHTCTQMRGVNLYTYAFTTCHIPTNTHTHAHQVKRARLRVHVMILCWLPWRSTTLSTKVCCLPSQDPQDRRPGGSPNQTVTQSKELSPLKIPPPRAHIQDSTHSFHCTTFLFTKLNLICPLYLVLVHIGSHSNQHICTDYHSYPPFFF